MQHPPPPQQPPHQMGSVPPANITTEQIQKYLDENKQLILAILDNQNSGKLAECAQYQAQLQKNLLYLAAIADAQPQVPAVRPQMIPNSGMPQGGGAQFMQQAAIFPPKGPPLQQQFTTQQVQELQQQQQLHHRPQMMSPFQGHMGGMRPLGVVNGMHTAMQHAETSHGRGNTNEMTPVSAPGSSTEGAGNRHEGSAVEHSPAAAAAADNVKNSAAEHGSRDVESPAQMKKPEDAKTP